MNLNNINWSQFITPGFWFSVERGTLHLTDKIILGAGAALVILGVLTLLMKLLAKNFLLKPALSRISSVFLTIGLLEMLWYLLRIQYVNVLASRVSALVVLIFGCIYLVKPIKYFWFEYRPDLAKFAQQQQKEKYLKMK